MMGGTMPLRDCRLVWPVPIWPAHDRRIWQQARGGHGVWEEDNPAYRWSAPTTKNNENGYGRYLGWLHRNGLLFEEATVEERITPKRIAAYQNHLSTAVSPVSVAAVLAALSMAVRALSPETNWSWLVRR